MEVPNDVSSKKKKNRRPIECRLCPATKHFYVTHSRGNTLHRGGYGYVMAPSSIDDSTSAAVDVTIKDPLTKKETTTNSHHFLFVEEVLFLFEQGLLHAYCGDTDDLASEAPKTLRNENESLSRLELFQMLTHAGISLPTYLVYQHLRAQTYRVVRHTSTRLPILVQQIAWQNRTQNHGKSTASALPSIIDNAVKQRDNLGSSVLEPPGLPEDVNQRRLQNLKRQLRWDARKALPPAPGSIAWDGYRPSASFSSAAPGLPDFYVAITYMTNEETESLSYLHLRSLLQQTVIPDATDEEGVDLMTQKRIPLKIATVADSGTVLLFGITDCIVPTNQTLTEEEPRTTNDVD